MPWKDLRREDRRPFFERAFVQWEENGASFQLRARCVNLSPNGMAIETYEPLPERETVGCSVPALNVVGMASVRYCKRRGLKRVAGLEFYDLVPVE
jgi:hypothetical protein